MLSEGSCVLLDEVVHIGLLLVSEGERLLNVFVLLRGERDVALVRSFRGILRLAFFFELLDGFLFRDLDRLELVQLVVFLVP